MTDETTTETTETEQPETEASRIRQELERALNENKELKAKARNQAFKDAGFDTESGQGAALAKLYEGPADAEAIAAAAAEYGLTPNATNASAAAKVATAVAAQATIDAATSEAVTVADRLEVDNAALQQQALAEGDILAAVALEYERTMQAQNK